MASKRILKKDFASENFLDKIVFLKTENKTVFVETEVFLKIQFLQCVFRMWCEALTQNWVRGGGS